MSRQSTPPADDALARVAFVGTGPGAPGLLTVRGADLVAQADVIILDKGTPRSIVDRHARAGVRIVEAPEVLGENAAELLGSLVREVARKPTDEDGSAVVVRLMDGASGLADTLRAELATCLGAGLAVEVVPGVSYATAVPTYAGIPWASAGTPASLVISRVSDTTTWSVAGSDDLAVTIMGEPEDIATGLERTLSEGRDPYTDVALVANGSTTEQRTTVVALGEAVKLLRTGRVPGAQVAVVGGGVADREAFSWFESLPLFGWRVLVPRTKAQASSMMAELQCYGAVGEIVPTISVEPPRTPAQMDKSIEGMVTGRYEWVGFTSVNAVRAVKEKFAERGLDSRAFAGLKIAAVGGVTADALRAMGLEPDLIPSGEQSARGLLEDWPAYDADLDPINGVFLPRADIATDVLVAGLQELGWAVDDVTAYRTVRAAPPPAPVREAIKKGDFDAVLFTSSSTVRNLVGIAGKPHASTVVACIGPATAATAQEHGLTVSVVAPEPSAASLVAALATYGTQRAKAAQEAGERLVRPSEKNTRRRRRS
ncbi:uroporphyrinogen III methyltransferase / synthase [Austwickia chelonae]|uniref:Putative uroporphyrinogen-III synthase n=1 Tax=Austwickia chelonae NBRC 105200 TaxID=1184607 RepID=K6VNE2_9MICO|nr:uroporphyrinogen-III synthase [Austwickia chelonae]GAB76900.1 putative uroporphyrinogen-III synthase [Austwickia chelonae NBRC 105200]SEW32129.1 uroporphyrinogen III methyltransferase / synthase [Austwickia chelonae]